MNSNLLIKIFHWTKILLNWIETFKELFTPKMIEINLKLFFYLYSSTRLISPWSGSIEIFIPTFKTRFTWIKLKTWMMARWFLFNNIWSWSKILFFILLKSFFTQRIRLFWYYLLLRIRCCFCYILIFFFCLRTCLLHSFKSVFFGHKTLFAFCFFNWCGWFLFWCRNLLWLQLL